jgi:EAL domain-containing protein (putative c-di-GMP-specific phosphodiesterase class I)
MRRDLHSVTKQGLALYYQPHFIVLNLSYKLHVTLSTVKHEARLYWTSPVQGIEVEQVE